MKRVLAAVVMAAGLMSSIGAIAPQAAMAASQLAQAQGNVNLRAEPSMKGKVLRTLSKGEQVTVLKRENNSWWKVQDKTGKIGYVSSSSTYIALIDAPAPKKNLQPAIKSSSSEQKGEESQAVFVPNAATKVTLALRTGPSVDNDLIHYLKIGEQLQVKGAANDSWYAVVDATGRDGYVCSDTKYVSLTGTVPDGIANPGLAACGSAAPPTPTPAMSTPASSKQEAIEPEATPSPVEAAGKTDSVLLDPELQIEAVVAAGLKYLGTPYEYGSDRSDTSTFDCSDFVRRAFLDGTGMQLPVDSRGQGQYVKNQGSYTTEWNALKRGDLLFFGTLGSKAAVKEEPPVSAITHVGIYLGDNKILHTYSKESGGVLVTEAAPGSSWQLAFLFGGSALQGE